MIIISYYILTATQAALKSSYQPIDDVITNDGYEIRKKYFYTKQPKIPHIFVHSVIFNKKHFYQSMKNIESSAIKQSRFRG